MDAAHVRPGELRGRGYTIVHRSQGRIRLRLDSPSASAATTFAASLALHPSTTEVRWVAAARSMTLHHDPLVAADGILASARRPRAAAVLVEKRQAGGWPGTGALGLLPRLGVSGLVLELAGRLLAPPSAEVLRRT
ncbi:MAG: hypothetical protein NVSMB17_11250 [Candidatus Dormibacteria bacterium]